MIRWRELLDRIDVGWLDRGRNVQRGWLAVRCPWCDDPSAHLGINEEEGHWRCLRCNKSGRSAPFLLHALGARDIDKLLREFDTDPHRRVSAVAADRTEKIERYAQRWETFKPAQFDPEALRYLAGRGFPDPEGLCERFDLRTGTGKWAGRLWFPLRDLGGGLLGFTGRTMRDYLEPRYWTQATEVGLYLPELPGPEHSRLLLVEGPVDALRVAGVAIDRYNELCVAALCGLAIRGLRLVQLKALAHSLPDCLVSLDASVSRLNANKLIADLKVAPWRTIRRFPLPAGADDPGGMTDDEVARWLS
ncbi:MAG: hypothetical protein J2P48_07645 [Alphaproteobacteria bacterium]|nr:hypothetical protein [Alphaproteobacteria bacterium]